MNKLKTIFFSVAAVSLTLADVAAESLKPIGVIKSGNDVELVTTPVSTLVVDLTVERENVAVGPYARFAQKYLGLRAPLVAKESCRIVAADVSLAPEGFYFAEAVDSFNVELLSSESDPLPVDVKSSSLPSLEESAEKAADEIFYIRALRSEMLSGDLGEGFFGGGLVAALDRFEREESEYVELFMGRTTRSRSKHRFYLSLEGTTPRYIVARFSDIEGVVDSSDLLAEPIVVQLTPLSETKLDTPYIGEKSTVVTFRVPSMVKCDLYISNNFLASKSMPLNEFGYNYQYPISQK